jgi:ubiquinone/menaquinone biosynthesis C-methylase UbiE
MKKKISPYVCPETLKPLHEVCDMSSDVQGELVSEGGKSYIIKDGIPDLIYPAILDQADEKAKKFYEGRADDYDKYLPLTFKTHNEDEQKTRNFFVDLLQLKPGDRVLDLACGTGRDSEIIAERLGDEGELFCQDISSDMLRRCIPRLKNLKLSKHFALSNALYLPFPDKSIDAVYSFGGLGEFSDIRRSLQEMVRVTKTGGKIVVGDESIPPWLRKTEFAKILGITNPQFWAEVPLEHMPVEARDVCLRWVIGGVFYLIEFKVGNGEPVANFDFEIPGPRGGTYRTRCEGLLEGVTPEAKGMAYKAIQKRGISMHQWLDEVVKNAAMKDTDRS